MARSSRSSKDEMEVEERLLMAKQKREKEKAILSGKSLVDEIDEEDTASWVNRSRKIQEQKQEEEQKKKLQQKLKKKKMRDPQKFRNHLEELDEQYSNYDSNSLKGLKVAHDFSEFKEGETTILTLKDSFIINDNYQINEDEDELENVEKAEYAKIEERKKPTSVKYNPILELENSNNNNRNQIQNDISSSILSKYNEKEKKKGIILEGEVTSSKTKEERLQEIRSKLSSSLKKNAIAKVKPTPLSYNLNDDRLSFSNANSTTQSSSDIPNIPNIPPPVSFKKRRAKKKKEENVITPNNPLISELLLSDINNAEDDEEDYGSRSRTSQNINNNSLKDKMERQHKRDAYAKALDKAKKVSLSLLNDDESLFHDDNELFESIENTRKQYLSKNDKLTKDQLIERSKSKWKERESQEIALMNSNDPNVFSTTREFCRNISITNLAEKKEKLDIPNDNDDEELKDTSNNMEISNDNNDEGEMESKENKNEGDDPDNDPIIDVEPDVSEGLFSALQLFNRRGTTIQKERDMYVGRKGDVPFSAKDDPAPHINLEHRDEFGRILTQREIFRKMSHKFHNKLPGKNKLEKNLRKYQEELKLKNMSIDDTPLRTVEKMKKEQERTGLAYVDLSASITLPNSNNEAKNMGGTPSGQAKTSKLNSGTGQKVEFGFTGNKRKTSTAGDSSVKKIKF